MKQVKFSKKGISTRFLSDIDEAIAAATEFSTNGEKKWNNGVCVWMVPYPSGIEYHLKANNEIMNFDSPQYIGRALAGIWYKNLKMIPVGMEQLPEYPKMTDLLKIER